jgi:hypothetical protein
MSFSYRIRRKLMGGVALGFAAAAVAAPSALATGPMYHGAGLSGSSAYGALHQAPNAGLQTSIGVGLGPQTQLVPRVGILTGNLPAVSFDGPRTGPANVTESPVLIGGRFGRPDLAPNTGPSHVDVAWRELGIGLGIGVAVALALAAIGLGMTPQRGTLQGA